MRCGKAIRDGAGQFATQSLFRDAARHVATKTSRIKIGVNTGKAMRHGSLRRGTPRRYKRRGAYMTMRESPQGMEASIGCAAGDGMGGGIFAKTAKTPPLQSGVCGDGIAIRIAPKGRPLPPPCAYHATPHAALLWRPYGFHNDAARRVATFIEKWNCLIETFLPARRKRTL